MTFLPEGRLGYRPESKAELLRARDEKRICEGTAVLCDRDRNIVVDLGFMRGVIPRPEGAWSPDGEVKDIAVISRVGKPVCFTVTGVATDVAGGEYALLSRREAMRLCSEKYVSRMRPGDVIDARVTRPDSFGAFVDIGCGIIGLLPIDAISVSRIAHPAERFAAGQDIRAVVSAAGGGRITLSHRELLGTWAENAARFEAGQTVAGIVRSVEKYGVFVELTPNLAGLAESGAEVSAGDRVSVYIKSIIPEKMKVKLVIIDRLPRTEAPRGFDYPDVAHIGRWRYSPESCPKVIESVFE
ncbi:MAG: 30S ribosomal protein S1 [Clostridia bacterium]|nr:30S ribosomal protein S1 [Clostridia bacterium]